MEGGVPARRDALLPWAPLGVDWTPMDAPRSPAGGETIPIEWTEESDLALLRRLGDGDTRALELIIRRWSPRLSSFVYRLTGDAEAVEDVVQESFIRLHAARATAAEVQNFSAWIHTIARRLVLDRVRTARRRPVRLASEQVPLGGQTTTLFGRIPDNAPTPSTCASNLELLARLDEALQGVPEIYREAVVLCDLQCLSYDEAAAVLGVPRKTVSSRLARGRDALRQRMAQHRSGLL